MCTAPIFDGSLFMFIPQAAEVMITKISGEAGIETKMEGGTTLIIGTVGEPGPIDEAVDLRTGAVVEMRKKITGEARVLIPKEMKGEAKGSMTQGEEEEDNMTEEEGTMTVEEADTMIEGVEDMMTAGEEDTKIGGGATVSVIEEGVGMRGGAEEGMTIGVAEEEEVMMTEGTVDMIITEEDTMIVGEAVDMTIAEEEEEGTMIVAGVLKIGEEATPGTEEEVMRREADTIPEELRIVGLGQKSSRGPNSSHNFALYDRDLDKARLPQTAKRNVIPLGINPSCFGELFIIVITIT